MAGMTTHGPCLRRVAGGTAVAVAVAAGAVARAQPEGTGPAQLIGTWRGTSICTDRVAAPACHDETVVYEFKAGTQPGTVRWVADKVVSGQRARMYEFELAYDKAEGCWKVEFSSPRAQGMWCLTVDGARLSGTARLQPGKETVRKVDLRRSEPKPLASTTPPAP